MNSINTLNNWRALTSAWRGELQFFSDSGLRAMNSGKYTSRIDWMSKGLIGSVLALSLTACKTTDDPREGGFIGGVQGLSSGAYERRIEEREERLERLRQLSEELDAQRMALEHQHQQSLSDFEREQARLATLSRDTEELERKLLSSRETEQAQQLQHRELLQRVQQLKQEIDRTVDIDHAKADSLGAERDALEKEYRLLLDIYREISQ